MLKFYAKELKAVFSAWALTKSDEAVEQIPSSTAKNSSLARR